MEGGDRWLRHPNPSQKGLTSQGLPIDKQIVKKAPQRLAMGKNWPKSPWANHPRRQDREHKLKLCKQVLSYPAKEYSDCVNVQGVIA